MQKLQHVARKLTQEELKVFLEQKADQFNRPGFVENDPVCIPHLFTKKEDIEIAGFFAAMLAWGQRVTIIRKCKELMRYMDNDPHRFILHHRPTDLKAFTDFKHRTFNATDALYFIQALRMIYVRYGSMEAAFSVPPGSSTIETGLINFHHQFFSLEDHPARTKKHIATPERKSTCKRLVMYLRWMVRSDKKGVDFGIWNQISPSQLVCPCDLHVDRVARKLKLIKRKQTDWQTALELTSNLKKFDPE